MIFYVDLFAFMEGMLRLRLGSDSVLCHSVVRYKYTKCRLILMADYSQGLSVSWWPPAGLEHTVQRVLCMPVHVCICTPGQAWLPQHTGEEQGQLASASTPQSGHTEGPGSVKRPGI